MPKPYAHLEPYYDLRNIKQPLELRPPVETKESMARVDAAEARTLDTLGLTPA